MLFWCFIFYLWDCGQPRRGSMGIVATVEDLSCVPNERQIRYDFVIHTMCSAKCWIAETVLFFFSSYLFIVETEVMADWLNVVCIICQFKINAADGWCLLGHKQNYDGN